MDNNKSKKCKLCKYKDGCAFSHNGDYGLCPLNVEYLDFEEHDKRIRADEREKAIDEFIAWLYRRKDISFHEKENMKEWFLAEQLNSTKQ